MGVFRRRVAVLLGIGICTCLPLAARAQENDASEPLHLSVLPDEETEGNKDWNALLSVRGGKKRVGKPSLRYLLRNIGHEWPRLLNNYVQPAVRGLIADQQGGYALAIRSTLFNDERRSMSLSGGVGRNFWGEREARLQFNMRF